MNNLNLDQLRTFVAACEKGSFSAVARDMGRAQSAVSSQIQNLELDLGLDLFDRSGKYPSPTAAAQALLPLARQAIGQLRRFQQAADSYQSGEEPLLRIVFEELVMPDKLNDMLAAFSERFPHTQVRACNASHECAIRRIAEGDADFAFVTTRDHYPDEVDFNNLGQQRILTLACPEHPLAQMPGAALSEAAQYRQLVAASPSAKRRWQLSPQTWHSDSLLQALDLACKGVGWVNAPYELARPFLKSGKLVELNLTNALSAWSLGVDLLWSASTPQGTAARWFAREARRLYGNYYSPPIEVADSI
ncbi:DNA-binding transcriptional regulator, LysR family [Microbulbifer donghaiensis]|uniref:DNA-binding transcriptional regulator, LysR family n=1 Tax=Microbulbifer donghaiensis TaxID=494016 RepID=A0A1M5ATQ7_9GAMM|nr:LysR family transcriptional regulator [Microbulbifer donghaiensis]SHF33585.1 DNA-binding transcriptional regulator, LysR family [Microbulbifer donghaiensis]